MIVTILYGNNTKQTKFYKFITIDLPLLIVFLQFIEKLFPHQGKLIS